MPKLVCLRGVAYKTTTLHLCRESDPTCQFTNSQAEVRILVRGTCYNMVKYCEHCTPISFDTNWLRHVEQLQTYNIVLVQ